MTCESIIRDRIRPVKEALVGIPGLGELFERCFLNSVQTTITQTPGDTFVITGDIPAMWLRDSTCQVLHYVRFSDDPAVAQMLEGVIARQALCILRDPYANAFNKEESSYKPYDDAPRASDWVWERKYELDSLCYPMWLAEKYMIASGRTSFLTDSFHKALQTAVSVIHTEQHHERSPYRFTRRNCPYSDTLHHDGMGEPVSFTGMSFSGFRPSDDACRYGYLVPSNLFAVRALRSASVLAGKLGDEDLKSEALSLAEEIRHGVEAYATVTSQAHGTIYAYEVDGLGSVNLMDDANVPSLLSLPYLEVCDKNDPVYLSTRRFVLSADNPYYYTGKYASGVGSPHTPQGYIWPIALCVQAMTSTDDAEISALLHQIITTHADTGFMHESFDPNEPANFTRSWFAWANSMLGELIYRLWDEGRLAGILDRM